jgi:hypothetical protein
VSAASYRVDEQDRSTGSTDVDMTSVSKVAVRAIRPGLVRLEKETASTMKAPTKTSSTWNASALFAANGLVEVIRKVKDPRAAPSVEKLTRIGNMKGKIFPVAVGNHFSYTAAYRVPGTAYTATRSCRVTRKLSASAFHAYLNGTAYVAECDSRHTYPRDSLSAGTVSTVKYSHVFFEALGLWLDVNPTSPKETLTRTSRGVATSLSGQEYHSSGSSSAVLKAFTASTRSP